MFQKTRILRGGEKFDNEPEFILKFIEARAKYINSRPFKLD